jgi:hypothetical protein
MVAGWMVAGEVCGGLVGRDRECVCDGTAWITSFITQLGVVHAGGGASLASFQGLYSAQARNEVYTGTNID